MKIKKLAAICKKKKRAIIYERQIDDTDAVQQYISDGYAIYPVFGLPRLDKENLLTIFDVDQSEWNKWHVSIRDTAPDVYVQDVWPQEQPIGRFYQPIVHSGDLLKSVQICGETVFFNDAYMDPVRDGENLLYYGRANLNRQPVIVVKSGLLLQAAIMPVEIANEDWLEMMEEMLAGCRKGAVSNAD